MQEIIIEVGPSGDVTVGVKGVAGPDCQKLTEAIEDAVGDVMKRTKTAEYVKPRTTLRTVGH